MAKNIILIMLVFVFSLNANAVCTPTDGDGSLASETCGVADVSFSVPALARVSQLDPFDFGVFDFETSPEASDDFCIWYNTGSFSMTVNSLNTASDNLFSLLGSNSNERINYQVFWYDQVGKGGVSRELTRLENVPQNQLVINQVVSSDCTTNNSSLGVSIPFENLQGKPEDEYSDILTVTVSVQ